MAKKSKAVEEGEPFAFLGVFFTVVGFILVLFLKRENKYAMYYAKQGLVLFFGYIAAWLISLIFSFIPFIGKIISTVLWILLLVLWITGLIYSLSGKEKEIPIVGEIAKQINL